MCARNCNAIFCCDLTFFSCVFGVQPIEFYRSQLLQLRRTRRPRWKWQRRLPAAVVTLTVGRTEAEPPRRSTWRSSRTRAMGPPYRAHAAVSCPRFVSDGQHMEYTSRLLHTRHAVFFLFYFILFFPNCQSPVLKALIVQGVDVSERKRERQKEK